MMRRSAYAAALLAAFALPGALPGGAWAQELSGDGPAAATPPAQQHVIVDQPLGPVPPTAPGGPLGSAVKVASGPLPPGQAGIGNVGGKTNEVCVPLVVTAGNAYGANYVVGGLLTFQNAFTSTGTGILQDVVVTIKDLESSGFVFIPFNVKPAATTWTDAAVAAINAADVTNMRSPVPLAGNIQLASSAFSTQYAYSIGQALAPGSTTLYGVLLANTALSANFAAANDVQVCVTTLPDL